MSALARLDVYENLLIRQEISVHCLHLRVLVLCSSKNIHTRPSPDGGHFSFRLSTPCNFHSRRGLSRERFSFSLVFVANEAAELRSQADSAGDS